MSISIKLDELLQNYSSGPVTKIPTIFAMHGASIYNCRHLVTPTEESWLLGPNVVVQFTGPYFFHPNVK